MTDGNRKEISNGTRVSFAAKPKYDRDKIEAETALIHYAVFLKLKGSNPSKLSLNKLGLALGRNVDTDEIIKEAERISENAKGTDIEKAAKRGDIKTAFWLMDNDPQVINYIYSRYEHIPEIIRLPPAHLSYTPKPEHKPNTATVKDISRKATQAPISIIRTVRTWFRKIEKATRPNDNKQ